jgi:large subunit ribosomal protein L17
MANRKRQTSQRQSNVHSPARRVRTERNQLTDLIIHGQIVTNHAKAKELQKKMDKLITKAKNDTVHNRRQVAKVLRVVKIEEKQTAVQKLFEIAKKYEKRNGGYTRVLKYGNRKGDNSPISIISFV